MFRGVSKFNRYRAKNQQSIEGDDSIAELQKTSTIVEPVFIQGLKEIIHNITSGKIKL